MTKSKQRTFTSEFNAQVVLEVISGVKTFSEACRQYQLSEQTLSRWKQEFVQHVAMLFEHSDHNDQEHKFCVQRFGRSTEVRSGGVLQVYLERWLEQVCKLTMRPNTYKQYYSTVHHHLIPAFVHSA